MRIKGKLSTKEGGDGQQGPSGSPLRRQGPRDLIVVGVGYISLDGEAAGGRSSLVELDLPVANEQRDAIAAGSDKAVSVITGGTGQMAGGG